jgi:hypothetical protein
MCVLQLDGVFLSTTSLSARVIDDDKTEPLTLYLSLERDLVNRTERRQLPPTLPIAVYLNIVFFSLPSLLYAFITPLPQRRRHPIPLNKHQMFLDTGSDSDSTSLIHCFPLEERNKQPRGRAHLITRSAYTVATTDRLLSAQAMQGSS